MAEQHLDSFLIRNAEVIRRLDHCSWEAQERLWEALWKAIGNICEESFDAVDGMQYETEADSYGIYKPTWILNEVSVKFPEEFDLSPGLWLPVHKNDGEEVPSLLGLSEDTPLYAHIWATPLSMADGKVNPTRELFDEKVSSKLTRWERYPKRSFSKPSKNWGVRVPVILRPDEVAEAMEAGELIQALGPFQAAIDDFKSVMPAIDELVERFRKKK